MKPRIKAILSGPRKPASGRGRPNKRFPGLHIQQASEAIGVSNTYLSRILNGHETPGRITAQAIADQFGWSLNDVYRIPKARKAKYEKKKEETTT